MFAARREAAKKLMTARSMISTAPSNSTLAKEKK